MINLIIKICGICEPEIAMLAAESGAHYIGIVFHPPSPRHVALEHAISISLAARLNGAIPVAIFVNQTAIEMKAICERTQINTVQLHGALPRAQHHLLPTHFQRLYVVPVTVAGEMIETFSPQGLDPKRDYILIDQVKAGQGQAFNWSTFTYHLPFPWLLAGGLSATNVAQAINLLMPQGVDVSSGVERSLAKKDHQLIKTFIHAARGQAYVQ